MARAAATAAHRADLAEFLRLRRTALSPSDVGMPPGQRRRTPGLRREEVAFLAGVSVSWYTWLEQGRPINASRQVLEALARTLRLDPVETDHLIALAGQPTSSRTKVRTQDLPDDLQLLLDALEPAPAYVLDPAWNFIGVNAAQLRLYPGFARLPAADRNLVMMVFANRDVRALIGDWEAEARRVLSQFRAETTAIRDEPVVRQLVERLRAASPEFADWWPRHDVAGYESRLRTFHHPVAGRLTFRHEQLAPSGHPDLRVVVHLPLPGDSSLERLAHSGHVVA
jgi:transcriptional regulator with XRE-family HTH domain